MKRVRTKSTENMIIQKEQENGKYGKEEVNEVNEPPSDNKETWIEQNNSRFLIFYFNCFFNLIIFCV